MRDETRMEKVFEFFEDWEEAIWELPVFFGMIAALLMAITVFGLLVGIGGFLVWLAITIFTSGIGWLIPYILVGVVSFAAGWMVKR